MNEELNKYIEQSKKIVIFTGAGISTESGIPDFRGPQGVWKTNTPIYFQDFIGSEEVRRESWKRKFSGKDIIKKADPNVGHFAVAEIINNHPSAYLITQNVDNLHQDAGVPDDKITEIHGNASYASCLDCSKRYELKPIKEVFLRMELFLIVIHVVELLKPPLSPSVNQCQKKECKLLKEKA